MHSITSIFSVFVIFISFLCSSIYSLNNDTEDYQISDDKKCLLPTSNLPEPLKMPIMFKVDDLDNQRAFIMYPNVDELIEVEYDTSFNLSCINSVFKNTKLNKISEILVTCKGNQLLQYENNKYEYTDLTCTSDQKSDLKLLGENCPAHGGIVATVGFQTKNYFISLYNICFNTSTKNSLYSWFDVRIPYFNKCQTIKRNSYFKKSKELFETLDVKMKYVVKEQKKTVNTILNLPLDSNKFVNTTNNSVKFMARGHLAANSDFFYAREQHATFYYSNTAPQWQVFNNGHWSKVERVFKNELANNTNSRRTVVVGTYGSCTLPDKDGKQQPLFLAKPALAVPLFFWKMLYDKDDENNNIVYIGLNNPYAKIKDVENELPCPKLQCPGFSLEEPQPYENDGLVYCCTKKSFENVYGQLDPIVFR